MPDILVEVYPGVYFYMRDDGLIGLSIDTKKEPTTDGIMYMKFSFTTLCEVVKQAGMRYFGRCYPLGGRHDDRGEAATGSE